MFKGGKMNDIEAPQAPQRKSNASTWIAILLTLVLLGVIGAMFYMRTLYGLQDASTADNAAPTPELNTSASPRNETVNTKTDNATLESELKAVDADLNSYSTSSAEVDSGLNDKQEDLSE